MRVALFFDGSNFQKGLDAFHHGLDVDYDKLAAWLVDRVAGESARFVGAWYYTGLSERSGLDVFLRELELCTGYFVRREPVVERPDTCTHCGAKTVVSIEKRVDTRLVAEMIQLAAVNAFDVAVVMSGDEDLVPGVEAVAALGKQVFVGTWGGRALAHALRVRCFGHVDLNVGVEAFATDRVRGGTIASTKASSPEDQVLVELRRAEGHFGRQGGHVSRRYFTHGWRPRGPCPASATEREAALRQLVEAGKVEIYTAEIKGRKVEALRTGCGEE